MELLEFLKSMRKDSQKASNARKQVKRQRWAHEMARDMFNIIRVVGQDGEAFDAITFDKDVVISVYKDQPSIIDRLANLREMYETMLLASGKMPPREWEVQQ